MSKEEVVAVIGEGECAVKTLTRNHLYCEPPTQQPSVAASKKREATDTLPEFTVRQLISELVMVLSCFLVRTAFHIVCLCR